MDFSSFDNSFYIYKTNDGSLNDSQLLSFITTSVQTLRVNGELYFGCPSFMEGPEYVLIREPIIVETFVVPEEIVEEPIIPE